MDNFVTAIHNNIVSVSTLYFLSSENAQCTKQYVTIGNHDAYALKKYIFVREDNVMKDNMLNVTIK